MSSHGFAEPVLDPDAVERERRGSRPADRGGHEVAESALLVLLTGEQGAGLADGATQRLDVQRLHRVDVEHPGLDAELFLQDDRRPQGLAQDGSAGRDRQSLALAAVVAGQSRRGVDSLVTTGVASRA
jgi:hypothetical protein